MRTAHRSPLNPERCPMEIFLAFEQVKLSNPMLSLTDRVWTRISQRRDEPQICASNRQIYISAIFTHAQAIELGARHYIIVEWKAPEQRARRSRPRRECLRTGGISTFGGVALSSHNSHANSVLFMFMRTCLIWLALYFITFFIGLLFSSSLDGSSTHLQHAFMHKCGWIDGCTEDCICAEYGRGNQSGCTCACRCTYWASAVPAAFTEIKLHFRSARTRAHTHTRPYCTQYISSHNIFVMPLFVHLHQTMYSYMVACIHCSSATTAATTTTDQDDACLSINLHFRCYIQLETLFKHKYTDQLRCTAAPASIYIFPPAKKQRVAQKTGR